MARLFRFWHRRRVRDARGQAAFFTLMFFPLLLALGSLGISISQVWAARVQAQTAADAAALAGSHDLPCTPTPCAAAVSSANAYAASNGFSSGVTVHNPPQTGPHSTGSTPPPGNSIEVIIQKQISPLGWGWAYTFNVNARSVATVAAGSAQCVLCLLGGTGTTLSISNNANLCVSGGGIAVDSTSSSALNISNNADLTDTVTGNVTCPNTGGQDANDSSIGLVGCYNASNNADINATTLPTCGISPVANPLANLAAPQVTTTFAGVSVSNNQSRTLNPGVYPCIQTANNVNLTLNPGVYVITGASDASCAAGVGFSTSNNTTVSVGSGGIGGVTLYLTCPGYSSPNNTEPCTGGNNCAPLNLSNNGSFNAPTSGAYQGLALFLDPRNTCSINLSNNASAALSGTVYAKSAPVHISNNGGISLTSNFLVASLSLSNNADLTINYNPAGSFNIPWPSRAGTLTE